MAYSTLDDLKKRLPDRDLSRIMNDTPNQQQPDQAIVDDMIAQADGFIDGKLGGVYTAPLTVVPQIIVDASANLAIYFGLRRKSSIIEMPPAWAAAYKDAVDTLSKIAAGEINLPDTVAVTSQPIQYTANAQQLGFFNSNDPTSLF